MTISRRSDPSLLPRWICALVFAGTAACQQLGVEPHPGHAIVFGKVVLANGDPVPNVPVGYSDSFANCDVALKPDVFPARTKATGDYRLVMTSGTGSSCVTVAALRQSGERADTIVAVAPERVVFRSGESGYDSVRVDIHLP